MQDIEIEKYYFPKTRKDKEVVSEASTKIEGLGEVEIDKDD